MTTGTVTVPGTTRTVDGGTLTVTQTGTETLTEVVTTVLTPTTSMALTCSYQNLGLVDGGPGRAWMSSCPDPYSPEVP